MIEPVRVDPRLGRVHIPDERDTAYPMRARLPRRVEDRTWRYWWAGGWWGDQGLTPQCVAYAWLHRVADGPRTYTMNDTPRPAADPAEVYTEAQTRDPWEGENYAGTTVRAGAKVLRDRGLIGEFRWGWSVDDVVTALLVAGPVVLGTRWYEQMMAPGPDGFLKPEGEPWGGHAYVANGVNTEERKVRIKNSWGRAWGLNGYAWMSFETLDALLADAGEACLPVAPDETAGGGA